MSESRVNLFDVESRKSNWKNMRAQRHGLKSAVVRKNFKLNTEIASRRRSLLRNSSSKKMFGDSVIN